MRLRFKNIVVGLGVLQLFSTKLDDAPLPGFWNYHRPNLLERRLPPLRQRQAIAKKPSTALPIQQNVGFDCRLRGSAKRSHNVTSCLLQLKWRSQLILAQVTL
ncbi:hypothetical protein [Allocoleopsis sp.]|uniref:hypothetical protein n=1 Tax=Allocoleopsis sp. TaxID=3088169 RepID=UPI002FD53B79